MSKPYYPNIVILSETPGVRKFLSYIISLHCITLNGVLGSEVPELDIVSGRVRNF